VIRLSSVTISENVEPKVQETLAAALQYVRDMKAQRPADLRLNLAHADGVISGLENAGILTGPEAAEWKRKLWEIVEGPAKRVRRSVVSKSGSPAPNLGFIKLVPGPQDPAPILDGFMRIVALELLEDRVRVHWTLYPLPSYEAVLGDDLKRLDADTAGLAENDREGQRFTSRYLRLHNLLRFSGTDDLGTNYRYSRGGSSGSIERGEESGIADFQPAAPIEAKSFVVKVHEATITILLT
jgi:hypothetical protein